MGYYTYYNMDVYINDELTIDRITDALKECGVYGDAFDCGPSIYSMYGSSPPKAKGYSVPPICYYFGAYDSSKWYDHDEDMKEISAKFPGVLFVLHGEGEESCDLWDAYYLNGKMQHCQAEVIIPPFDPAKLE